MADFAPGNEADLLPSEMLFWEASIVKATTSE